MNIIILSTRALGKLSTAHSIPVVAVYVYDKFLLQLWTDVTVATCATLYFGPNNSYNWGTVKQFGICNCFFEQQVYLIANPLCKNV